MFQIKIIGKVYVPPKKLRKRKDVIESVDSKIVQPNAEATGVELHKDSKFYQSWQNFKVYNLKLKKLYNISIKLQILITCIFLRTKIHM